MMPMSKQLLALFLALVAPTVLAVSVPLAQAAPVQHGSSEPAAHTPVAAAPKSQPATPTRQKSTPAQQQQPSASTAGQTRAGSQTGSQTGTGAQAATSSPSAETQANLNAAANLGLYGQAQMALASKNYNDAIRFYQEVLSKSPDNSQAHHGLAKAYYLKSDYEKAAEHIQQSLQRDPVNTQLYFTQAQILDAQGKPKEALESYLMFSALNPQDTASLAALTRANQLMTQESKNLSQDERLYFEGLQMLSLSEPQEALKRLSAFHAKQPENAESYLFMGRAYLDMQQPRQAIHYFQAAVTEQKTNPLGYYHLASSYDLTGNDANARQAWKKFIEQAPHSHATSMAMHRVELPSSLNNSMNNPGGATRMPNAAQPQGGPGVGVPNPSAPSATPGQQQPPAGTQ
jgi:tetratricopeptide (TPR) repeat protein